MEENIDHIPISEDHHSLGKDLAGFGRPVDYVPSNKRFISTFRDDEDNITSPEFLAHNGMARILFINALSDDDYHGGYTKDMCDGRLTTLREFRMMKWMNVVTDKESWDVKVVLSVLLLGKGWR